MSVSEVPLPAVVTTMPRYPLAYVTYDQQEMDAVSSTLRSGWTTCGPRVAKFEAAFAERVGRQHAIMTNSGSSADMLLAFGLGPAEPGDEILVPAVTWPTQVWACLLAGYRVRLVDVDPETLQFDLDDMVGKLTQRTRAIFLVHVLGLTGDITAAADCAVAFDIPLIEDCCEALGAQWEGQHVGTFGTAAAYSFFFSHLITTMEGGMVVTDDADATRRYRLWRSHGWEPTAERKFSFSQWGFNVRPTELQGAFGSVQLGKMERFQEARRTNAYRLGLWTHERFTDHLRGVTVLPNCFPSWHGFPLLVSAFAPFTRDDLCRHLEAHGIETRPIIAGNLARQAAVCGDDRVIAGELPGADLVHESGFYIGLASFDDTEGPAYVAEILGDFVRSY